MWWYPILCQCDMNNCCARKISSCHTPDFHRLWRASINLAAVCTWAVTLWWLEGWGLRLDMPRSPNTNFLPPCRPRTCVVEKRALLDASLNMVAEISTKALWLRSGLPLQATAAASGPRHKKKQGRWALRVLSVSLGSAHMWRSPARKTKVKKGKRGHRKQQSGPGWSRATTESCQGWKALQGATPHPMGNWSCATPRAAFHAITPVAGSSLPRSRRQPLALTVRSGGSLGRRPYWKQHLAAEAANKDTSDSSARKSRQLSQH